MNELREISLHQVVRVDFFEVFVLRWGRCIGELSSCLRSECSLVLIDFIGCDVWKFSIELSLHLSSKPHLLLLIWRNSCVYAATSCTCRWGHQHDCHLFGCLLVFRPGYDLEQAIRRLCIGLLDVNAWWSKHRFILLPWLFFLFNMHFRRYSGIKHAFTRI